MGMQVNPWRRLLQLQCILCHAGRSEAYDATVLFWQVLPCPEICDASMNGRETSNDHQLEHSLAVTETKIISPLISASEDLINRCQLHISFYH
jgi:hypothetical protein